MTAAPEAEKQPAPQDAFFQIILNFWMSRALYIFTKLDIPDLLKDGPKTTNELAAATTTHAPSLYRLLRALGGVGAVKARDDGKFELTSMSELLVTDAPGSMKWFMMSELGQEHYPAWGNLMHSVKTGEIAFDNLYGMNIWEYFAKNPDDGTVFNNSMSGVTAVANETITSSYDFSGFHKLVDVGGGHGGLATGILKKNPNLKAVVFDAAGVISGTREKINAAGLSDRCEAISGDFFESVPAGGDVYILKWIIHDWDDEKSIKILRNIRQHVSPESRLIIVDAVVPEGNEPHFSKFFDLNMLVMTGGKERTEVEFRQLLLSAGFKLLRVIPTDLPTSMIEAQPL